MYRDNDLAQVIEALDAYLREAQSGEAPVFRQPALRELSERMGLQTLMRGGGLAGERLRDFIDSYLDNATRLQHPMMMGHQVACPHPGSILGGFIDAATGNPTAIYEMGAPGATIEFEVVNWMLEKVGWTPQPYPGAAQNGKRHGSGVLTHGGSLAQLTALAAARSHADPDIWLKGNNPDLVVVVAPRDAHYSVARALGILGMGQRALIGADCDDHGRLLPDRLPGLLERLDDEGKEVAAVCANACCTPAGLYDPLDEVGAACNEAQVWFHVDGAHGASALLSDKYRHLMHGIERADSLIWDAHKMMRSTGLCAAVLVKDHTNIERAFSQEASYLFHDKEQPGIDHISRTVECTKAALGLKFFMGLAVEGEKGIGDYVTSRYDLAIAAAELIEAHPRYELAVRPQANIVCFRVDGLSDDRQLELRKRLLAEKQAYITTTSYMGRRWLRFTFMTPETELAHVEQVLQRLLELADDLTVAR